jgi:hypothetical protein
MSDRLLCNCGKCRVCRKRKNMATYRRNHPKGKEHKYDMDHDEDSGVESRGGLAKASQDRFAKWAEERRKLWASEAVQRSARNATHLPAEGPRIVQNMPGGTWQPGGIGGKRTAPHAIMCQI